ncbi:MAG: hypothetical protein M3442_01915, partial [Chloroflexota bacterium]|nr:hypothetical protein [Chloroflexota bacterium]
MSDVPAVTATLPLLEPPAWAVLQRQLFSALDQSVAPFLERYTHPDGTLIWGDTLPGRDGADDFYESSYNWPLLYLLGGGDHLLTLAVRQWEAITRQVTALRPLGQVHQEYERGYDWFHQGESNLYFYFLCLAAPDRPEHLERARRFAGLYLNEDPKAPNYDPQRRLIRAPHNGSAGPRYGFTDSAPPRYGWSAGMARYGLPFHDVPGIAEYDDLKSSARARRMGEMMQQRLGRGDVPANLAATSLLTNAYLLTGDERYRQWVVEYTGAWIERAARNGGLLPDNVGLSGEMGEYTNGKWYGGLYGWTWPHGFYNIAMAAIVAAANAHLLTKSATYLDLARSQIDHIMARGEQRDPFAEPMSLREHWAPHFAALSQPARTFLVPYRYRDSGWFDYQPLAPMYPTAIWGASLDPTDWDRLERLRAAEPSIDWRRVIPFRSKEDAGHEPPWLRFLAGDNPTYPEQILRASLGLVHWRLDRIRADTADLATVNIHHWQQHNPVLTEALVQLTLGAPSPIYNGGLLHAPLRHFDADRRRPGLPPDVAALVTNVTREHLELHLVNLSPVASRAVVLQAGAFGEHRFDGVRYTALDSSAYPGGPSYA